MIKIIEEKITFQIFPSPWQHWPLTLSHGYRKWLPCDHLALDSFCLHLDTNAARAWHGSETNPTPTVHLSNHTNVSNRCHFPPVPVKREKLNARFFLLISPSNVCIKILYKHLSAKTGSFCILSAKGPKLRRIKRRETGCFQGYFQGGGGGVRYSGWKIKEASNTYIVLRCCCCCCHLTFSLHPT